MLQSESYLDSLNLTSESHNLQIIL